MKLSNIHIGDRLYWLGPDRSLRSGDVTRMPTTNKLTLFIQLQADSGARHYIAPYDLVREPEDFDDQEGDQEISTQTDNHDATEDGSSGTGL